MRIRVEQNVHTTSYTFVVETLCVVGEIRRGNKPVEYLGVRRTKKRQAFRDVGQDE